MNNKVYLWHPKYKDFWIVLGMENHWLLGICYVISDRNHRRKEYLEVKKNPMLANEDSVNRFSVKQYIREIRNKYRMLTLECGDQPSLLIED